MGRHQTGHVYEASGAFYVRFYTGRQKLNKKGALKPEMSSHRLCETNDKYYSRTCKAVKLLRDQFMSTVNTQPIYTGADIRIADFWEQRAGLVTIVMFTELESHGSARLGFRH